MSQRELSRIEVFRQLLDKRLKQRQAADLLRLSVRQVILA
jgi:Trp operon repressor